VSAWPGAPATRPIIQSEKRHHYPRHDPQLDPEQSGSPANNRQAGRGVNWIDAPPFLARIGGQLAAAADRWKESAQRADFARSVFAVGTDKTPGRRTTAQVIAVRKGRNYLFLGIFPVSPHRYCWIREPVSEMATSRARGLGRGEVRLPLAGAKTWPWWEHLKDGQGAGVSRRIYGVRALAFSRSGAKMRASADTGGPRRLSPEPCALHKFPFMCRIRKIRSLSDSVLSMSSASFICAALGRHPARRRERSIRREITHGEKGAIRNPNRLGAGTITRYRRRDRGNHKASYLRNKLGCFTHKPRCSLFESVPETLN